MELASTRSGVVRLALRNGQLRSALVGYLLFNLAEWAGWIALLVWAYEKGGVNGASAIALVQLVPAALLASPLTALLGRISRPGALLVSYAAQTLSYAAVGVSLVLDAPIVVVALAGTVAAVTVTLTRPAHNSLLPEISESTGELTAGNAASGTMEAVATLAGPLVSGAVLAAYGPGAVILVCAAFLLGATLAAIALLRGQAPDLARRSPVGLSAASTGVVARDPRARLFALLVAAEYVLVGMLDILLVVLALDLLGTGPAGPGILNSALGIGGILGAAATFLLVGRSRLAPYVVLGALVAGVAIAGAGFTPGVVLAVVLVAAGGGGRLFFDVGIRTFVQRVLPDRLLAAVFGLQESMMMAGLAAGSLAAPALVAVLGTRGAFIAAGAFLPIVGLVAWRSLARLDAETTIPLDVLALLQGVPILAVLPVRILERLARDASEVRVAAGTALITEGERGETFYVIESGRAEVSHGDEVIRVLDAGGWCGELALLRDVPRTASVSITADARLWALDRESFLAAVTGTAVEVADEHARTQYR